MSEIIEKNESKIVKILKSPPSKERVDEEVGRLHHIDDGLREEQSNGMQWQNLYARREIMVLGMGLLSLRKIAPCA